MVSSCSGHCGRAEWLPQLPCVLTAMMAAAEHTVKAVAVAYLVATVIGPPLATVVSSEVAAVP